jgi:hypothetical protein
VFNWRVRPAEGIACRALKTKFCVSTARAINASLSELFCAYTSFEQRAAVSTIAAPIIKRPVRESNFAIFIIPLLW